MYKLSPNQVVDALRTCSVEHRCSACPLARTPDDVALKCMDELMKQAAEVIEELSAMVPRWISVDERKPDKELAQLWAECGRYSSEDLEVLVVIEGAGIPTTLMYDGTDFVGVLNEPYRVVKWMPMPGI